MSVQSKVDKLNGAISDYATKSHLWDKYLAAKEINIAEKNAEIAKMIGVNSAITIKLRKAILDETNGDLVTYLAKQMATELSNLDLANLYIQNESKDHLPINISSNLAIPDSIKEILEERSAISCRINSDFSNKLKETDEYLALTKACNESLYPNINPFNCVHRCFANELLKIWGDTLKGVIALYHGVPSWSPSAKPLDFIMGAYAGMGETDYYVRFSDEDGSDPFWKVKWVKDGKSVAQFIAKF